MYLNHRWILSLEQDSPWQLLHLFASKSSPAEKPGVLSKCTHAVSHHTFKKLNIKQNQQSTPQSIRCYLTHCLGKMASVCATDVKLSVPKVSEPVISAFPPSCPPLAPFNHQKKGMYLLSFTLTCLSICWQSAHLLLPLGLAELGLQCENCTKHIRGSNWNQMDEVWYGQQEKNGG